jgi:NAD(P)-dependent dehydrogenase (short-subunit alcohol dehydrogenase family)
MRSLAVELAPETRVNSVLPGALNTAMAQNAMSDADIVRNFQSDYPLGLGSPDDVASAVRFLLSDEARWITGQEIVVDGGRSVNFSLK